MQVCLSLLGTWSGGRGEGWDSTVSTTLQVCMPLRILMAQIASRWLPCCCAYVLSLCIIAQCKLFMGRVLHLTEHLICVL